METLTSVECDTGAIAFALNGASIFSRAVDGQCNVMDVDDDTSEWTSFDFFRATLSVEEHTTTTFCPRVW